MAVTDDKGNRIASYEYSPYGQIINRDQKEDGLTIPFLYNGQYGVTTDDSGLYYMRARYYNVDIRRFLNQDVLTGTLERISSLNRYAYVEGNPLRYLDPFGLERRIYDEWHNNIQELMMINSKISLLLSWIGKLPKPISDVYTWYEIVKSVILVGCDVGVCIGRAWEAMLNSNYNEIDISYHILAESLDNFVITITSLVLDYGLEMKVIGNISNAISWLKDYSDKIEETY